MRNPKKQCGHLRCGATCRFGKKIVKRKPLPKPTRRLPKASKPISKRSKKMIIEDRKYLKKREKFLKEHPKCECGREDCNRDSQDVHHTQGHGEFYLVVRTWKAVARVCHIWIHDNHAEAEKLGLLVSRHAGKSQDRSRRTQQR